MLYFRSVPPQYDANHPIELNDSRHFLLYGNYAIQRNGDQSRRKWKTYFDQLDILTWRTKKLKQYQFWSHLKQSKFVLSPPGMK